jgi:hypothetical protein
VTDIDGKRTVVCARLREGKLWDVYPARVGVVAQVNLEKHFSHVELPDSQHCRIVHSDFPRAEELQIGDVVSVKCRIDRMRMALVVLDWSLSDQTAPPDLCREFVGILPEITHRDGVDIAGVWVPYKLMAESKLSGGMPIKVVALNRKDGWRAIRLAKA